MQNNPIRVDGALNPVHTCLFLFEKGFFFSPVWPTVHTYQVENGQRKRNFSKTVSRADIFFKTPASRLRMDGRKGWFSNTVMPCIIYF